MSPAVDLGGIFTFNYGVEGDVQRDLEPGIKFQGLVRVLLNDSGKVNIGLNFAPGPLFYFGNSRTLGGLTVPVALVFGIPVSSAANIDLGIDLPFWFYFTQEGGAVIPILIGGGVEYFVEQNLAITFNTRMGPTIYTSHTVCPFGFCRSTGTVTHFDLQALIGVAIKL